MEINRPRLIGPVLVLLGLLLASTGCSATYIIADVGEHPLQHVANMAVDDYSVFWIDDDTLHLRHTYPLYSILQVGWTTFHANLHYWNGRLYCQFYTRQLGAVAIIPLYQGTEGMWLYGKEQMDEILEWAEAQPVERFDGSYINPPPKPPWDIEALKSE